MDAGTGDFAVMVLGILGLVAALLVVAGCVRACDVFRQLEAESRAREAALWASAFTLAMQHKIDPSYFAPEVIF